jgi:anti-sigma regulatory factor (Ser/Thr protein kinase)
LEREAPDTTLPIEERPIGGLGIYLVRQFMDTVEYEYTNGENILTVMKKV